jgi:hypothetical protein
VSESSGAKKKKNTEWPGRVSDLTAHIERKIACWKATAERNFKATHPLSDLIEFEQSRPKTLAMFLPAETTVTTKSLPPTSEDYEN